MKKRDLPKDKKEICACGHSRAVHMDVSCDLPWCVCEGFRPWRDATEADKKYFAYARSILAPR